MAKYRKSSNLFNKNLPVSKKAYETFVERINTVFSESTVLMIMLCALDDYLAGRLLGNLPPDCAMAFAMLKFDIDVAIERSARARKAAQERKIRREAQKENSQNDITDITDNPSDCPETTIENAVANGIDTPIKKSRRERRAELHELKRIKKKLYRKLIAHKQLNSKI